VRENSCLDRFVPFPGPEAPAYAAPVATLRRPSRHGGDEGGGHSDRLRGLVLGPPRPSPSGPAGAGARAADTLGESDRAADDKERLVGLLAAPFAAAISLLVYGALAASNPPAYSKGGLANPRHVPASLYVDLLGVLLVLAVAMLATAWLRRRLPLGCAMALYGLAVFNLHYWGFGVPYLLFGAWMIARAYRARRDRPRFAGPGGGRTSVPPRTPAPPSG
jgi:hypothetical protein